MTLFNLSDDDFEVVKVNRIKSKGRTKDPTKLNILTLKVEYISNDFMVKYKDKYYVISNPSNVRLIATELYSTPLNTLHANWTKQSCTPKIPITFELGYRYWAPYKPGNKITGKIVKDKFIVTSFKGKDV